MYKTFHSIESLYNEIEEDKHWTGAESGTRNRYPLRFVLFEKFKDFYDFVEECSNHGVYTQSIERWMESGCDDNILTYSQLAARFKEYVKKLPANDFVIAPFSEIARFYDNQKYCEFDALLQSIRLIESPEDAQREHQRIYVPIIGMEGKMSKFKSDPNIHIWEYHSGEDARNYRLIVSKSTYGVRGLEEAYSLCGSMKEWISLWKVGNKVDNEIICTSKAIYNNAHNAQPDNAFEYAVCHNAYEFLAKGLQLDLHGISTKEEDMPFWEQLARQIDVGDFNFEQFVTRRFNVINLSEDASKFIEAWLDCNDDFSRWLLKSHYLRKQSNGTYLGRCLLSMNSLKSSELFSALATTIFDDTYNQEAISLRSKLLREAADKGIQVTELTETKVKAKLMAMAASPERGYYAAMQYITPLTRSERSLMIEWLGKGFIQREQTKRLFPRLYAYTEEPYLHLPQSISWINEYFKEYVASKIANMPSEALGGMLRKKNANEVAFEEWKNQFKTVKTYLYSREDIEVYYWIDGLGTDWIPFIAKVIEKHNVDSVYLNEVYIATAELPTTTAVNKAKLEELATGKLQKIGDIDSFAHTQKEYPTYIIDELEMVEKAIHKVLTQYNGKKIAFVSDHGISYMAGHGKGLNIAGITPNHQGRCAVWENGKAPHDNNYAILSDGQTICSLTYDSLASKTPIGQGAHGGATPEEVLVPIIIVSSQKNASNYSAKLMDNVVLASNPVLRYTIKGLSSIDNPMVTYNDVDYKLHRVSGDIYESERLKLVETAKKATLKINSFQQTDVLDINTGAQEEELF